MSFFISETFILFCLGVAGIILSLIGPSYICWNLTHRTGKDIVDTFINGFIMTFFGLIFFVAWIWS